MSSHGLTNVSCQLGGHMLTGVNFLYVISFLHILLAHLKVIPLRSFAIRRDRSCSGCPRFGPKVIDCRYNPACQVWKVVAGCKIDLLSQHTSCMQPLFSCCSITINSSIAKEAVSTKVTLRSTRMCLLLQDLSWHKAPYSTSRQQNDASSTSR